MLFVLALLAFFAIAMPDAMLGVAWPFMRITFDQPLAALTLVLPFGVAATVVSTSSWTWAASRLGLGRLLAASTALSAVALLSSAVAPAYGVIVGCAVVFGLSAGAIDAALNSYAARHFGPRQINLMHAAYGAGAATSPLIVTMVISANTSWRFAYLIVMIIQGALAMLFARSARRWDKAAARPATPAVAADDPSPRTRVTRRPHPRAVTGLLLVAVESGLESVLGLWAFVFLLEAVALRPVTAGGVVAGYWAALVVGRVLLGSVAERVGTWPVLAAATVATVAAAGMIMSQHPVLTAAGVVVLGLAVAPIYPLLVLTTAERTTGTSVDRLVGYQAAASTLGSVVCAGLVGLTLGADLAGFVDWVMILALLTGGGTWALRPGQSRSTTAPIPD